MQHAILVQNLANRLIIFVGVWLALWGRVQQLLSSQHFRSASSTCQDVAKSGVPAFLDYRIIHVRKMKEICHMHRELLIMTRLGRGVPVVTFSAFNGTLQCFYRDVVRFKHFFNFTFFFSGIHKLMVIRFSKRPKLYPESLWTLSRSLQIDVVNWTVGKIYSLHKYRRSCLLLAFQLWKPWFKDLPWSH